MNSSNRTPAAPSGSQLTGRLWVIAAALLWSSCGVIVKAGYFDFDEWGRGASGPLLAFWRGLFATLVLLPFVRRPRWDVRLVPLCVCFLVMSITFLTAMVLTTTANAIWLQATSPWWVFLLSVLLLREPVVRRDLVPLAFGAAGVGWILCFEIRSENVQEILGVVCGVLSGVTFGSVLLFMRRLRGHQPAFLVALCHAAVAVVMLPWVVAVGIWPTLPQLGLLAVFGAFQMAVPYLFMIRGLRHIRTQEAVAIGLLEPVLMPLWVYLLGLETPHWWTVVGASLILAGLLLRYVVMEWIGGRE